jgi:hypothetical protein
VTSVAGIISVAVYSSKILLHLSQLLLLAPLLQVKQLHLCFEASLLFS